MKRIVGILLVAILISGILAGCSNSSNVLATDDIPPELSLVKSKLVLCRGQETDYLNYVSAFDSVDGDLSSSINILSNDVDINKPGEYAVVFQVKDSAENSSTVELPITVLDVDVWILIDAITEIKSASESQNLSDMEVTDILYALPPAKEELEKILQTQGRVYEDFVSVNLDDIVTYNDIGDGTMREFPNTHFLVVPLIKINYSVQDDLYETKSERTRFISLRENETYYISNTDVNDETGKFAMHDSWWQECFENNAESIDVESIMEIINSDSNGRPTGERYSGYIETEKEQKKEKPEIGMTEAQVLGTAWGTPKKKNTTTTKNGVSEQWVYGDNRYVYLDNGIVTAIQE